jgi:Ca2+/Na+ antiporter
MHILAGPDIDPTYMNEPTMKKSIRYDLAFIIMITILLVTLSETGRLEWLVRFPFVTLIVVYGIGRFVGSKVNAGK